MNHVHWWLCGLSFALGLVLTLALTLDSIKPPVPVRKSMDAAPKPDPPTTRIPVADEPPTTRIAATEQRTTKIPVPEQRTTKIPVAEHRTTKIPIAMGSPTTKIPVSPEAPFGPGSARATPDGDGPAGWLVKGLSNTRLYYTPDDPTYDPTVAELWFSDEKSAAQAGFTPWRASPENPRRR
jgi:uncharacterized membrane protein ArfC